MGEGIVTEEGTGTDARGRRKVGRSVGRGGTRGAREGR